MTKTTGWTRLPGKHRLVFDTTTADGFRDGLLFASNFMLANRNDYGLQNQDLAVIVVARHLSTAFGYNNAMWAKYGASLAGHGAFRGCPGQGAAEGEPQCRVAGLAFETRRSVRRVLHGDSQACRDDRTRGGRERRRHLQPS